MRTNERTFIDFAVCGNRKRGYGVILWDSGLGYVLSEGLRTKREAQRERALCRRRWRSANADKRRAALRAILGACDMKPL